MKKFTVIIFIVFFAFTSLFFGIKTLEKRYFNEQYEIAPNFIGLSTTEAAILAKSKGLAIKQVGEAFSEHETGKIYQQLTIPGKKIKTGRTIQIYVSKGKSQTKVPNFTGIDVTAARILAEKLSINISNIISVSSSVNTNKVIASDPPEGEYLAKNGSIVLLVSLGKTNEQIYMPDIVGLDISKAKEVLRKHNLIIGNIDYITDDYIDSDIILDSNPHSGEKLNPGTVINITVNKR